MKKEDTFLNEWAKIKTAHEKWLKICAIRGWKNYMKDESMRKRK